MRSAKALAACKSAKAAAYLVSALKPFWDNFLRQKIPAPFVLLGLLLP